MLGLRQSDLVASAAPPGAGWLDLLAEAWEAGAAVLPLDHRLPPVEAGRILAAARPTVAVDGDGAMRLRDGEPVDGGVALVVATSGTSGEPKLAELGTEALRAAVSASARRLEAGGADAWISCLPVAHMGGMLVAMRALLLEVPVELHPAFDPGVYTRTRAVFTSVVPATLARLLDEGVDLGPFRSILVGGSGLSPELAARAAGAGVRLVPTYGLTESCGGVVYDGVPLDGVEVRVDESGGEVLLRGPVLFRRYRGDAPATASRIDPDGWLRTGDAGTLDGGRLRVLGRLDELIVTGGEKVWPQEVEAALRPDPAVREVLVTGRPDPVWGQVVVAHVVPTDPAAPPTLDGLRDAVAGRLARHKVPRELMIVPSLPVTPSGKLRRPRR